MQHIESNNASKCVHLSKEFLIALCLQSLLSFCYNAHLNLHAICLLHLLSGDRKAAEEAYKKAEAKTAGSGPKMDMVFSTLKYAH